MADLNPLFNPQTDNQAIAPEVQSMLNQPLKDESGWTDSDQAFLNGILEKVENKTINLYSPSSLLNNAVYESLSPELKAKADQNAVVLITKIREIVDLHKLSNEATYQIKNLVEALQYSKSRLEEHQDIYII